MNEWELICKWIRDKGVPKDAEISLAHPSDGRIWIDVLSESYGKEKFPDAFPYPDECYYDPTFIQYMLVPVGSYYRTRTALENALEYLESVDN